MQMWPVDPSGGCSEAGQPEIHVLEGGAGVETDVPTSRVWIIANRVGIAIGVEVFQKHLISVDDVLILEPELLIGEGVSGGEGHQPLIRAQVDTDDVSQAITVEVSGERDSSLSSEAGVPPVHGEPGTGAETGVPITRGPMVDHHIRHPITIEIAGEGGEGGVLFTLGTTVTATEPISGDTEGRSGGISHIGVTIGSDQEEILQAITIHVSAVGLVFRVRSRGDSEGGGPGGGTTGPGVRSAVVDDHFSGGSIGDPFVKAIAIHIAGDGLVPVFIVVLGVPGTRPEGTVGGEGLSVVVVTGIETTGAGEVQGDVRVRVVVDHPIAVVVAVVDVLGVGGVDAVGEVIAVAFGFRVAVCIHVVIDEVVAVVVSVVVVFRVTRMHTVREIIAIPHGNGIAITIGIRLVHDVFVDLGFFINRIRGQLGRADRSGQMIIEVSGTHDKHIRTIVVQGPLTTIVSLAEGLVVVGARVAHPIGGIAKVARSPAQFIPFCEQVGVGGIPGTIGHFTGAEVEGIALDVLAFGLIAGSVAIIIRVVHDDAVLEVLHPLLALAVDVGDGCATVGGIQTAATLRTIP